MKKFWLIFLCFLLIGSSPIHAQNITKKHVCGLHEINQELYFNSSKNFTSNQEAEAVVNWIMSYTGLPVDFIIQEGKVANALAAIVNLNGTNVRAILYNAEFMQKVKTRAITDWGPISVLAHEIGHHLSGHTLLTGNNHQLELEADEFSGFILQKMGSSLKEAQAAMKAMASNISTTSHPAKSERLKAIEKGWRKSKNQGRVANNNKHSLEEVFQKKEASNVTFSNILTEQSLSNGKLKIYANVSLPNSNNQSLITAWFYDKNSQPLKDRNGKYHTSSFFVATHTVIDGRKNGFLNRRISLEIPVTELHLSSGVHELLVVLGTQVQGMNEMQYSEAEKIFVKI